MNDKEIRSGSWDNYVKNVRCAFRLGIRPDNWNVWLGFRVVKENEMNDKEIRGGSRFSNDVNVRCADRGRIQPAYGCDWRGFRVVKENEMNDKEIRSGSWLRNDHNVRCANRLGFLPGGRSDWLGFRVVGAPAVESLHFENSGFWVSNEMLEIARRENWSVQLLENVMRAAMPPMPVVEIEPLPCPINFEWCDIGKFQISKYLTTNAQYRLFVEDTGYDAPPHWETGQIPKGKEDHPVVNVSWYDAQEFCGWGGVRLPTADEWYLAATGGDNRTYPWGDEKPTEKLCNYDNNVGDTTPVFAYPDGASPYGLFDMAGNVWEWTATDYK